MAEDSDLYFLQLVVSLQMGTMQHLGKTISPVTGKIERNLEMAKHSINMLEMVHKKTQNNLSDEERKLLEGVLYDLRLNYVEEAAKGEKQDSDGGNSGADADTNPKEQPGA